MKYDGYSRKKILEMMYAKNYTIDRLNNTNKKNKWLFQNQARKVKRIIIQLEKLLEHPFSEGKND